MNLCAKKIFNWLWSALAQKRFHSFITAICKLLVYMFILISTAICRGVVYVLVLISRPF